MVSYGDRNRRVLDPCRQTAESDTVGQLQAAIRQRWEVHEKTLVKVVHDTSVYEDAEDGRWMASLTFFIFVMGEKTEEMNSDVRWFTSFDIDPVRSSD